ncbi:hypothetical protein MZM54_03170 [[Brevibacterium] frigoritolerans]|nr:hypothetical protein [Peribacillus frigoritolerans]
MKTAIQKLLNNDLTFSEFVKEIHNEFGTRNMIIGYFALVAGLIIVLYI